MIEFAAKLYVIERIAAAIILGIGIIVAIIVGARIIYVARIKEKNRARHD